MEVERGLSHQGLLSKSVPKPFGVMHSTLRLLPRDPTARAQPVRPGPYPSTRLGHGRCEGHCLWPGQRGGGKGPSGPSVQEGRSVVGPRAPKVAGVRVSDPTPGWAPVPEGARWDSQSSGCSRLAGPGQRICLQSSGGAEAGEGAASTRAAPALTGRDALPCNPSTSSLKCALDSQ